MSYFEPEKFEAIAKATRKKLGIDDQVCPDMATVIFKLQHLDMISSYERVSDHEMREDLAEYNPETRLLRLRESVFVAANDFMLCNSERHRARFTIAHEIGHIALGHKRTRHRNISQRQIEKIASVIRQDEYQANKFASAFLAPASFVNEPLTASSKDIANLFDISLQAAAIRLEDIQRQYRRLNKIMRPTPIAIAEYLRNNKPTRAD